MAGWSRFLERASVEPFSFASLIIPGKELGCKAIFKITVTQVSQIAVLKFMGRPPVYRELCGGFNG